MQRTFGFAAAEPARWFAALGCADMAPPVRRRSALGQLIKSMLSGRTRDAVSIAAYDALVARYRTPRQLAGASAEAIAATVAPVTFAADKAAYIAAALAIIAHERPDFDLSFLAARPLAEALTWLERLPGVARKVSASTLNAGVSAMPVMIVDTHVLRVLRRLGFVAAGADYRAASEAVTAAMPDWSGDDFLLFHIALKRLGQEICRWDMAACSRCALAADCPTARAAGLDADRAPAATRWSALERRRGADPRGDPAGHDRHGDDCGARDRRLDERLGIGHGLSPRRRQTV